LVAWSAVTVLTAMMVTSAVGRVFAGATGMAQFAAQTASTARGAIPPQVSAPAQDALNRLQGAANDPAARAQAEQAARQAGQQAAKGGARGSFGAALALLLGAAAAAYGGMLGKRHFLDMAPQRKEFLLGSSRA
jgi:hypothetical protein